MSAYLIILSGFAVGWSVFGFCVAVICLKLRWNLVGGILLLALGIILPAALVSIVYTRIEQASDVKLTDVVTLFGMLEHSFQGMLLVSCVGSILGALVGSSYGLWPCWGEEEKRERTARSMTTWKLLITGPIAVAVAWSLFFLGDLRAKSRLQDLKTKHLAILEVQEDYAPRQVNDAAHVHDVLMLALMQDEDLDGIQQRNRQIQAGTTPLGETFLSDSELLKIFLPNFEHTQSVRDYCQRHQKEFEALKASVLEEGHEYRHWDPKLARFVAIDAMVHLLDDEKDAAFDDLKLLRLMGMQSLDKRVEDSMGFEQIEMYRYLVFQAILGTVTPVPETVYAEMLTDLGDVGPSLRRGLKRDMSREIVNTVDELLSKHEGEPFQFNTAYRRAAERIIYQEHIPKCAASVEDEINQAFLPPWDPNQMSVITSFPSIGNDQAWLMTSRYAGDLQMAYQFYIFHHIRIELVRALQAIDHFHKANGRFPTQQEFLLAITTPEWTAAVPMEYFTLHNAQTKKAEGAIVCVPRHLNMNDQLGLYLGPGIFPIIGNMLNPQVRNGNGNTGWNLESIPNKPTRLLIPEPTG